MLDKNFLQSFLRVNNGSEDMPDTEVQQVLELAGWSKSEIDAALALLHGNGDSPRRTITESSTNFRSDMEFSSSDLSDLLGVDVVIDPANVRTSLVAKKKAASRVMIVGVSIALLAFGLAMSMGFGSAYLFGIQPFGLQ